MADQYRKKPVVIEAMQWDGLSDTANKFIGEAYGTNWLYATGDSNAIIIPTLEGDMRCNLGDWIIKGIKGEFYPCKPDIFEATYEKVWPRPVRHGERTDDETHTHRQ